MPIGTISTAFNRPLGLMLPPPPRSAGITTLQLGAVRQERTKTIPHLAPMGRLPIRLSRVSVGGGVDLGQRGECLEGFVSRGLRCPGSLWVLSSRGERGLVWGVVWHCRIRVRMWSRTSEGRDAQAWSNSASSAAAVGVSLSLAGVVGGRVGAAASLAGFRAPLFAPSAGETARFLGVFAGGSIPAAPLISFTCTCF
jgi:hypothetical protein